MLGDLMKALSHALYGSLPLALAASFLWGLMSMVLSPCHLVSVPLVMGYLQQGETGTSRRRATLLAVLFASGMIVSIALIGLVTSLMGRIAGDIGTTGNIILALVLVYVGISISGLVGLPLPGVSSSRSFGSRGPAGALLIGLVLGAALGPCTFAFMGPVLALMFSLGAERLGQAVALGAFFAVGHGLVVVFAGAFSGRVQKLVSWSGRSRAARWFRGACGLLVVMGGLYLLYKSWP